MEPVAISWLVASATSPLIAVLALWTVYVFHTYRKRWRTVDLFLLAVASQELISAVFTFSYAIVSLINPPVTPLCSFVQWGLISVRTFQIATLTSMVVDRALTVRWPYRYRFSVRRNQIRYHIAVLALMSVLVGVAAVFAHTPDNDDGLLCSGHPSEWDFKFVVFVLGFYGVLVLVSLVCTVQIEVHKCRNGGKHQSKGMPYQLPDCSSSELPVTTAITSPLDNESHTGSTRTLHRPYRHSSRRPYGKKAGGASDFRWPPVAVVSLVCFSVNHLPYLVLTALATAMPWLWSSWHEAMLSWMRLAEGVLVPLVLCVVDQPVRAALKRTFQRRSGALSPLVGDDGPLQMYFDKDHFRKRGAFGSVTPIGIITNYRRTPGKKRKNRKCKYKLPGLHNGDSIIEKSCLSNNFLSAEPLSKLSCADLTSLEVWQEEDEENFYATLSDDMSTFSCNSTDENAMNDETKICDEVYGGSFTTIANDDFEFHDTRPCGGEVRMRPSLTVDIPPNSSFRSSTKEKSTLRENKIRENEADYTRNEDDTNLMNMTFRSEEEKKDPSLFQTMEKKASDTSEDPDVTKVSENENHASTSLVKTRSSWFSMNDLDLIEKTVADSPEKVFVLPVKSESTLSLYRLRLDKHIGELLPVTKSENNINDDSGFGSATQTMNPIWPGHILPNFSDPTSTPNTKAIPPGIVTKKNYPCVLHPRMQKLPWISAWKKLGGGNSSGGKHSQEKPHKRLGCPETSGSGGGGVLLINDNFQLRQKETFHWKESDIYGGETTLKEYDVDPQDANEIVVDHTTQINDTLPVKDCFAHETSVDNGSAVSRKRDKSEKKRKSRKNSFKEVIEHSRPYGRVNDSKQDSFAYSTDATEFNNPENEENIYEEIVSRKSFDDQNRNEILVERHLEDKSYAQTDILKIAVLNEEESQHARTGFLDSCERTRDFALNINVGLPDENEKFRNRSCSDTRVVTTSPSIQNWGLRQVVLPPRLNNCNPERRMVFDEGNLPPLPSYNDVNVTYCVNNNLLEFIDSSDFTPERQMFDVSHRRDVNEDFNANNKRAPAAADHLQSRGQRSSLHRKELPETRHKDSAIRRRESKKDKTTTKSVGTSDMPEETNSRMVEHYPVVRRQSDSRIRNREVKRRKSSCKESRDAAPVVTRRESGRRNEMVKYDDGYLDCFDARKDAAKVHRKESYNGLWCKDAEFPFTRSGENWDGRHVNNPLAVENNRYIDARVDGYSRVGPAEMMHPSKSLHNNNRELSCSTEKINSNDLIRLKCGFGSPIPNQGNTDIIRSGLVEQEVKRIQVRNSSNIFPSELEEQWIRRRRSELAELCRRESQKDDRRAKSRAYEHTDLPEKDNRVRRKSSSTSKDRRAHSDLEGKPELNRGKRIRRQESLNEETKRRNAFPNVDETRHKRSNVIANDINRNESVKLNAESANNSNSNSRMDNSVHDRRDNGNFEAETEIFPFETFVKPPPYNLVKYHIAERSGPDQKERIKQKKVAITDYL